METATTSPLIEVRRSGRRKRTVSAHREGDTIVVLVPASLSTDEEQQWVSTMVERVIRGERRRRPDDEGLRARAQALAARYLPSAPEPASVRWVSNQHSRWGSCTPADKTIRLSSRLQGMPDYVVDYVVLHELAHLVVASHGSCFWSLLRGYPQLERARGFLDGVSVASGLTIDDDDEAGSAAPTDPETPLVD